MDRVGHKEEILSKKEAELRELWSWPNYTAV